MVPQKLKCEDNIVRRHRFSVRPACARIEIELHISPVVIHLDGLCEKTVKREWLVSRSQH